MPVTVHALVRPVPLIVSVVVWPGLTRIGDAVIETVGLEQTGGGGGGGGAQTPVVWVPFIVVPQLLTQLEPEQVLAAVHTPLGTQAAGVTVTVADELTTELASKQFRVYVVVTPGDADTLPEPTGEPLLYKPGVMFAGAAGLQVKLRVLEFPETMLAGLASRDAEVTVQSFCPGT